MHEPPPVADEEIAESVRALYGVAVGDVAFLAAGADADAAAYRVTADDSVLFLKLRRGTSPAPDLMAFLAAAGGTHVVAPRPALDGRRSTTIGGYVAVLQPFVEGRSGFEVKLTADEWVTLGAALRAVHGADPPAALRRAIRVESYASTWRDKVRAHLCSGRARPQDAAGRGVWDELVARHHDIATLVDRAERLAEVARAKPTTHVLCHGDIHAANVIVGDDSNVFIVDWDDPVMAPRERDLMFIGGGVGGHWNHADDVAAFMRGYGPATIDPELVAYYRCERIVEDIALFSDRLLLSTDGDVDRASTLRHFQEQFEPGNVVEIADQTYAALPQVSQS